MKILCQEHFDEVQEFAKKIKDDSFQKCLDSFKRWEQNPNQPCEIELYKDFAPYSFFFKQIYPDGSVGLQGGLLYHGNPDESYSITCSDKKWQIHT